MMSENHFDAKAASWDKNKQRQELAEAVARAITTLPITDEMVAMDFGCGTGLVSLPLSPKFCRIIAFDSSAGMLEMLQQKIKDQKIKNIEPVLGDIATAQFSDSFDCIFTSMTLHHVKNTASVLFRFSQLLKPGGFIAIADLDNEDGSFHQPGSGEKHHGFKRQDLEKHLLQFGFTAIAFSTVHQITKKTENGELTTFPVFLATAQKP